MFFGAQLGNSAWQTLWEFLTLLLALISWREHAKQQLLFVLGDNVAALQDAIALRGRGHMLTVARELCWRQAKWPLHFDVEHLPKDRNLDADALSRIAAVPPCAAPAFTLHTPRQDCPPWHTVWRAWIPPA